MYVRIDDRGVPHLEDAARLDSLKIVAPDRERLVDAFAGIGVVEGDHVWLSPGWLAAQGPADAQWQDGLKTMLAYAAGKGWTRPDGSVRAHVEIG